MLLSASKLFILYIIYLYKIIYYICIDYIFRLYRFLFLFQVPGSAFLNSLAAARTAASSVTSAARKSKLANPVHSFRSSSLHRPAIGITAPPVLPSSSWTRSHTICTGRTTPNEKADLVKRNSGGKESNSSSSLKKKDSFKTRRSKSSSRISSSSGRTSAQSSLKRSAQPRSSSVTRKDRNSAKETSNYIKTNDTIICRRHNTAYNRTSGQWERIEPKRKTSVAGAPPKTMEGGGKGATVSRGSTSRGSTSSSSSGPGEWKCNMNNFFFFVFGH